MAVNNEFKVGDFAEVETPNCDFNESEIVKIRKFSQCGKYAICNTENGTRGVILKRWLIQTDKSF